MLQIARRAVPGGRVGQLALLAAAAVAVGLVVARGWIAAMGWFVVSGLVHVAPLIAFGILIAAWVEASGAGERARHVFDGNPMTTVLLASLVGAITPVCGVTVLPLMVGLLMSGVPFAPVMAFWLSSPITDPAQLSAMVATLGVEFAVGKTVAAFALGVAGGMLTAGLAGVSWIARPLRDNRLVGDLAARQACGGVGETFVPAFWREAARRAAFRQSLVATTRLVLICLIPAFAAEFALKQAVDPGALAGIVGADKWYAIPLAVLVGAPAYLDGLAALPLTRGMLDLGMAPGAAMAFLVSGGVVSVWGAIAIAPVLRPAPFVLFLAVAVVGSMASGWVFGWWV